MSKQKKKSKYLATISLVIMAVGFILTLPLQKTLWGTILQGGFEAGLVGGLADWFAVTALFRHPLGIPIPHTALLPKNRQKITATIVSMLENDWLTKESIKEKIATISMTPALISVAEKEKNSDSVRTTSIAAIKKLIQQLDANQLAPLIEQELKTQLYSVNIASFLPKVVDQFSERRYDEKVLDYLLNELDEWANKESTKKRLGTMAVDAIENIKADGFMQFALKSFRNLVSEEKLGNIIQNLINKGIASYRDPDNQNRLSLLFSIQTKLHHMKTDEKLIAEINQWKTQLVHEWNPEYKIVDLLNQLRQRAVEFVDKPRFFDDYILPYMTDSLYLLKKDEAKMNRIESWLQKQSFKVVEKNHSKIGKLVKENLDKLDEETLIQMLENSIGKDLQWIRVNGAICGFLIGLILVTFKTLF